MHPVPYFLFLLSLFQKTRSLELIIPESDFSVSISLFHNDSSAETDCHISMASKLERSAGWIALGTGNAMTGSLMFILYPNKYGKQSRQPGALTYLQSES